MRTPRHPGARLPGFHNIQKPILASVSRPPPITEPKPSPIRAIISPATPLKLENDSLTPITGFKKAVRERLYKQDPYKTAIKQSEFKNQGWNSESAIFKEIIDQLKPQLIVEVGTWLGLSAIHMTQLARVHNHDEFEMVCVDTFLGSVEHWCGVAFNIVDIVGGRPTIYESFLSNVLHKELEEYITPFPCDSINASLVMERYHIKPDMIYIDAGHEYESIKQDLMRWKDILRVGGVMMLDDASHAPIQRAANEAFEGTDHRNAEGKIIWKKNCL